MTIKSHKSFRKVFIRSCLVIFGVLVIFIGVTYFWFVHNSKRLLIDLVNERSNGKLKLNLAEVTFDFTNNEVKIRQAKIISTNKEGGVVKYQVSFKRIILNTNSVWFLLANRSLEIRKIKVYNPIIEVYKNQDKNIPDSASQLSLGTELANIYNSIQDGISTLNTHSIEISNAKLILNNRAASDKKPIVFSNIYFNLKKLDQLHNKALGYLQNNTVSFKSSNQSILLSDGIHTLSFKNLSLQKAKNIILDSCTIIASPLKSSGSSYNIFFKKLALTGLDFESLYKRHIIRADSVYCENPVINMSLNPASVNTGKTAKDIPDIEKIIRAFSGNLDLGFLGVMNADIRLNIKTKKSLRDFHSGKVSFQVTNFRINPDSSKLISLKSFNMMVKGYQLYNSDSTSLFSFDSLQFANNTLLMNNFSVHTVSGKYKIRNYRDYTIRSFQLLGIDWSELIFNQNLQADEAILYDPVITFVKNKNVEISKKSILFNSHHTFDDFMDIDKLKIINGTVSVSWKNNNSFELTGLNLSLSGNNITDYKNVRLNQDIETLFFTNGDLKIGDLNAHLANVVLKNNNEVHADEFSVKDNSGQVDSKINDVTINTIYSDKSNNRLVIDGLKWNNGTIKINSQPAKKQKNNIADVLIKNIEGAQTRFQIKGKNMEGNGLLTEIKIASVEKNNEGAPLINGLHLEGETINVSNAKAKMKAGNFILSDEKQEFKNVAIERNNNRGNLNITAPMIEVNGMINNYFNNDIHIKKVSVRSPSIYFSKRNDSTGISKSNFDIHSFIIDYINLYEPVLNIGMEDSMSGNFTLPYSRMSEIKINDLKIDSNKISAGNLNLTSAKAAFTKDGKKVLEIDKKIGLSLARINFSGTRNSSMWDAFLTSASLENSNGFTFSLKANKLKLKDISFGNIELNNDAINNPVKAISTNADAWFQASSGTYITKDSRLQAEKISYDGSHKKMEINSINYHPLLSREAVMKSSPYQTDYISGSTGKILLEGFSIEKLLSDNFLSIEKVDFTSPSLEVYRDKLPPFKQGIRKKLFTEEIKNIDLPVSINEIIINDGKISYIEKNAKSRLDGDLRLTSLNGSVFNIKNTQLKPADSLLVDIKGRLLDKGIFNVQIHQSYIAPLYGFLFDLQIEPFALDILNPLIEPLSNVKLVTGRLDSLTMKVRGNDNFASGEMNFAYRDLHIHLLKKGGLEKTKILKSAESGLVNIFFVKNNNVSRTGLIYFERLKDHSFFNYMSKIIFSGISTSIGARRNSSYEKKYKKNNIQRMSESKLTPKKRRDSNSMVKKRFPGKSK